jgi:hypothetical protein
MLGAAATLRALPARRERLRVKVEPLTIDGRSGAHAVTPENLPPENRKQAAHPRSRRLLRFLFLASPERARPITLAGFGGFKVISIDYRMPPDHPYPAALDDAMTVWKAVVKTADPKRMADFRHVRGWRVWHCRWSCAPSRKICRCRPPSLRARPCRISPAPATHSTPMQCWTTFSLRRTRGVDKAAALYANGA